MSAAVEPIAVMSEPGGREPVSEAVASLLGVTKRYRNGVVALDGLSLELGRGEIVALLGPNGAGKSTAVKLMLGLIAATTGQVRIFGRDPRFAGNRLRTGVMLQVGRAPEMLRVREHIDLMRGYYSRPMAFAEIVRAAGLEGIESRMFGQLSGGQKQRVLFGLALAGDPDLVFLDEPTVGLDIEARRRMWAQIRSLRERGKTVLLTTHYLEEADALADRIVVINKGHVVCEGTPAQVKAMGATTRRSHDEAAGTSVTGVKVLTFETSLTREQLQMLTGVEEVAMDGSRATVTSSRPEQTLRELLALDLELSGLEIHSPALEDAFLALTSQD
ncbi:MAG TPA: ABC transporter ATP-binding protein [Acidobacteriaceae bacterium]|jgi:ABC-2 type transport system ATP-binding protein|nr:ABC transporter ATP-binding protein [Acidobacteriaceae bacterium]